MKKGKEGSSSSPWTGSIKCPENAEGGGQKGLVIEATPSRGLRECGNVGEVGDDDLETW